MPSPTYPSSVVRGLDWLSRQAIRMRRTSWNANMLADELWLILRGINPETTGPITVNNDTETYDQPELPSLNIPPIDFNFPEPWVPPDAEFYLDESGTPQDTGSQQPDQPNGAPSTYGTRTTRRYVWSRDTVPGLLQSIDGNTYNFDLYPNGQLITQRRATSTFDPPTEPETLAVEAVKLGDGSASTDTWHLVFRCTETMVETTTHIVDGNAAFTQTNVVLLQEYNAFIPSGIATTVAFSSNGQVPGRVGNTPGQNTVTLYSYNSETGDLEAGDTVTAFNMVTEAVGANKFLQMKQIDGVWFIDVEDCFDENA